MFYLITHIVIGKYYPSVLTQIAIGSSLYVLGYFLIRDLVDEETIAIYKPYILSLIAIDVLYIAHTAATIKRLDVKKDDIKTKVTHPHSHPYPHPIESEISDATDYRITHDLSLNESDAINIFSETNVPTNQSTTPTIGSVSVSVCSLNSISSLSLDSPKS